MSPLKAETVKRHARKCGADLVGIASMDRFEGLPLQMDPRGIFPEARSMVVLGFRIFRGVYRGIEEGTFFGAYSLMGYEGMRWVFQPNTLWNFTKLFEDHGFEGVPVPDNFPWSNIDSIDPDQVGTDFLNVNPSAYGKDAAGPFSRSVAPGRPRPDVFVPLKIAAFCAGLGEIGYSGEFLTPQFGPRQMFAAVLTDAPLEADPLFEGTLCDRCMACVQQCPAQAISATETVSVNVAGRTLRWARLDFKRCSVSFHGGDKEYNPFMVTEEDRAGFNEQPYTKSMRYKISPVYWYGRGLEGKRGCHMACMIHLEQQGKLDNRFNAPFRRKEPWKMTRPLIPAKTGPEVDTQLKIDEQ